MFLTRFIDYALGVDHQWTRCNRDYDHNVTILWEASRNRTLRWTDRVYWLSISWNYIGILFTVLTFSFRIELWPATHLYFLGLNLRVNAATLKIDCSHLSHDECSCPTRKSLAFNPPGWLDFQSMADIQKLTDAEKENIRSRYIIPVEF